MDTKNDGGACVVSESGLAIAEAAPPGVTLLSGPGRDQYRLGNLLFRCAEPAGDVFLKVYRLRKGRWNDFWGDVSERWLERKRGVGAARRRDTEAAAIAAWRAGGFDTPRLIPRERPEWIGDHPFLAMEFLDGATLDQVLADPARTSAEKRGWIEQLARDQARRHRRALESGERLLVHEHAMARHLLVAGTRLVTFDFEHAYQPDYPLPVAVTFEICSTARSLERLGEEWIAAFVAAYDERKILQDSCRLFRSPALRWRAYRWYEGRRRGAESKTAAMERLAKRLERVF
jgi:hypothetical protein